jgi:hypothetical protein
MSIMPINIYSYLTPGIITYKDGVIGGRREMDDAIPYSGMRKGEILTYVTADGVSKGKIEKISLMENRIFYQLENGDYAVDTHCGAIKTYPKADLLKAFNG